MPGKISFLQRTSKITAGYFPDASHDYRVMRYIYLLL
jgi:hypothetical protein